MSHAATHVLVVDDNEDMAELLSIVLTRHGFVTKWVGSLAAARGNAETADVLVCDYHLPDGTAQQLLDLNIPVIVASGGAIGLDASRCAEAGFSGLFIKPIDIDALCQAIERLVAQPVSA